MSDNKDTQVKAIPKEELVIIKRLIQSVLEDDEVTEDMCVKAIAEMPASIKQLVTEYGWADAEAHGMFTQWVVKGGVK